LNEKKIDIKNRVTLILGTFKGQDVDNILQFKNFEIHEEYHLIPLKKLLQLKNSNLTLNDIINQASEFTQVFQAYQLISNNILKISDQFLEFLTKLNALFTFQILEYKRKTLKNELSLAEIKKNYSDLSAKTDLLNKLNESLATNKKRLNYILEDYLNQKNRIEQLTNQINKYTLKIQELNNKKKECFKKINILTRELESNSPPTPSKDEFPLEFIEERDVSRFSKIRALQKEAKQLQGEISQFKKELNEISLKLNKIKPVFDAIKKDHDALQEVIQRDLDNISKLKREIQHLLKNKNISNLSAETVNKIKIVRNKTVIEEEIKEISLTIKGIKKNYPEAIISPIAGIINLKNQLLELNNSILEEIKKQNEIWNVSQINKKFKAFKEIESFMKNIEKSCNQFLSSINLSVLIQIEINDSLEELFLRFIFNRNDKENLIFQGLTTPEKVFFIISFYIAVNINADIQPIIFSNLFLPPIYNKKGSIFRTIKKIVPLIQKDIELKIHDFLFIMSNLPLKQPIENIEIINI